MAWMGLDSIDPDLLPGVIRFPFLDNLIPVMGLDIELLVYLLETLVCINHW